MHVAFFHILVERVKIGMNYLEPSFFQKRTNYLLELHFRSLQEMAISNTEH